GRKTHRSCQNTGGGSYAYGTGTRRVHHRGYQHQHPTTPAHFAGTGIPRRAIQHPLAGKISNQTNRKQQKGSIMKKIISLALTLSLLLSTQAFAAPEKYTYDPSHTLIFFAINHVGFSNPMGKFKKF